MDLAISAILSMAGLSVGMQLAYKAGTEADDGKRVVICMGLEEFASRIGVPKTIRIYGAS